MKRAFDSTPRIMLYFVGGVVLLVMALPYWLDWFPSHQTKASFLLADETASSAERPVIEVTQHLSRPTPNQVNSPLSRFGQYRLEAPRDEMLKAFDLRALTVFGADPAIYETATLTNGERFTGCFAGGTLKEAFVIEGEQQASADAIQAALISQYGQPTEQLDNNSVTVPPALLSPTSATDWSAQLASLPFHRNLVWNDATYHIEASIHYSSTDPSQSRAILAVHMRTASSPLNQTLSQYTAHTLSIRPAIE